MLNNLFSFGIVYFMNMTVLAPPKAMTPDQAIGMTVGQYLAINSLSRADLGSVLGITGQSASFRLNGKSKWTIEDLLTLSTLFGVTVNDLMPTPGEQNGWSPAPYVAPYVQQKPQVSVMDAQGFEPEPPVGIEPTTYSLRVNRSAD